MRKAIFLIGVTITIIGLVFLAVPKPFSNSDESELTLSQTMRVEAYNKNYFNATLGGNVSVTVVLNARFAPGASAVAYARGEGCIDLYVVDQDNFEKWLKKENYATYLTASGAHSSSFMFQSGSVANTYYVILDNSWRCTEKVVDVQLKVSSKPILGLQFQIAGLGLLSLGVLVSIYGLVKEKVPTIKKDAENREGDFPNQIYRTQIDD